MRSLIVLTMLAVPGLALAQQPTEKTEAPRTSVAENRAAAAEQKIAALEAKLQALLKEIQDLRGGRKAAVGPLTDDAKHREKADIKKDVTVRLRLDDKPLANAKGELHLLVSPDGKRIEKVGGDRTIVIDGATGKIIEERKIGPAVGNLVEKIVGDSTIVIDGATGKIIEKRAGNAGDEQGGKNVEKRVIVYDDVTAKEGAHGQGAAVSGRAVWAAQPGQGNTFTFSGGDPNTVHLTRVTYTLADGKQAKALDDFLKAFAKAKVLETKVEEDKLVVTTTPDVQSTVGQVVGLMTGKPVAGHNMQWQFSAPRATQHWSVEPTKPGQTKPSEPNKSPAK